MNKGKYYMTTAIAYTSGKPHIGNTYEIVLADSIARYKRKDGYDVFFQTGTDEHGQKIEIKAAEAGVTPKEFVDGVAAQIQGIWDLMNTSYDKFIRTTDDYHEKQVQKIFKKLYEQDVVSEFDLMTAQNDLTEAEARLALCKAEEVNASNNLSYTEVRSPVNGVASMIPYRVGALVSSSITQPLVTVSDDSSVYA